MTPCQFPGCGLPTRYRYICDDPENGPARPMCERGHSACDNGCGTWIDYGGGCEECMMSQEPPAEFFGDTGPDLCHGCNEELDGKEPTAYVDVEDSSPEFGPTGRLREEVFHVRCLPRGRKETRRFPKNWETHCQRCGLSLEECNYAEDGFCPEEY